MTNRWFRLYDELIDDPKVMCLPPELFRSLIQVWCLASQNDGSLPSIEHIVYKLRATKEHVESTLLALEEHGFIDRISNQHGTSLAPHSWSKRQYKSDSSTERVKRFRNGDETKMKRPQKQRQKQRQKTDTKAVLSAQQPRGASASDPVILPEVPEAPKKAESLITPEARELATRVLALQKIDPDDPRNAGTQYQVQTWLTGGWDGAAIMQAVETVMARRFSKGQGPPGSVTYFNEPIAQVIADRKRPLPAAVATPNDVHTFGGKNARFQTPRNLGPHALADMLEASADADDRARSDRGRSGFAGRLLGAD